MHSVPNSGGSPPRRSTRPISQVEIEQSIVEDLKALEEATYEFRDICDQAARAEVAFKTARAKHYLRSSGTIKERDYHADVNTDLDGTALEYKIAEGKQKFQAELLRTIRARIDGYRTLNANVREQV